MSNADRIQQFLSEKPGLRTQQIADELGLDRPEVAATLDTLAGSQATQDSAYRWWPRARKPPGSAGAAAAPRSLLANLSRYYLECLSRESGPGISIPAAAAGIDYVAIEELPFLRPGERPAGNERTIRKIVQKAQRERGQLTLYVGYALRVRTLHLENHDDLRIEPVLLY